MPSPEEIKKLSEAYAEYMCPVGDYCGGVYDDQRNTDLPIYKDNAKSVLEWLSKDYCIVEKSNVIEEYNYYKNSWNETELTETIMGSFETLFGTELFNEEKG